MADGDLVILDVSQDFRVTDLGNHMTVIPKNRLATDDPVPVFNRGCMWQDNLENIYISGGHFFSQPFPGPMGYWDLSEYFVQKEDIPDYSVWQYNLGNNDWTDLSPQVDSQYPPLRRLASAAYTSFPSANLSYAFGYVLYMK